MDKIDKLIKDFEYAVRIYKEVHVQSTVFLESLAKDLENDHIRNRLCYNIGSGLSSPASPF